MKTLVLLTWLVHESYYWYRTLQPRGIPMVNGVWFVGKDATWFIGDKGEIYAHPVQTEQS